MRIAGRPSEAKKRRRRRRCFSPPALGGKVIPDSSRYPSKAELEGRHTDAVQNRFYPCVLRRDHQAPVSPLSWRNRNLIVNSIFSVGAYAKSIWNNQADGLNIQVTPVYVSGIVYEDFAKFDSRGT